jgi:hypothetical protein
MGSHRSVRRRLPSVKYKTAQSVEVVFVCFDSKTYSLYNRLVPTEGNDPQ